MATAGMRLLRSSDTSPVLVVSRLRNMSTAIIDPPNRYSNTSWNAARKMSMNIAHTILPVLRRSVINRRYAETGSMILHNLAIHDIGSVTDRTMLGRERDITVMMSRMCGGINLIF